MIGKNKMELNEATMIVIVQEWIDRTITLKPQPKVNSVKRVDSGYDAWFEISLTDKDAEPSK